MNIVKQFRKIVVVHIIIQYYWLIPEHGSLLNNETHRY